MSEFSEPGEVMAWERDGATNRVRFYLCSLKLEPGQSCFLAILLGLGFGVNGRAVFVSGRDLRWVPGGLCLFCYNS